LHSFAAKDSALEEVTKLLLKKNRIV